MSKLRMQIVFDREDRSYRGGEQVAGEVVVTASAEVVCNGLKLEYFWQTHGKGNKDRGEGGQQILFEGQWRAGETYRYPFEFESLPGPPTYHGHHLNIDHYVRVRADIPWSFDPKTTEEFILSSGGSPYSTQPSSQFGWKQNNSQAKASAIIGVALVVIGLAVFSAAGIFGLLPIGIGLAVLFFAIRKSIAENLLGKVKLATGPKTVIPGEVISIGLAFIPKKAVKIRTITAKLTGREKCVSGSGTNKTTHTHILHEQFVRLASEQKLQAREKLASTKPLRIPETLAHSFKSSNNELSWELEVRIDIPLWPDWIEQRTLCVVPAEQKPPKQTTTETERRPAAETESRPAPAAKPEFITADKTPIPEEVSVAKQKERQPDELVEPPPRPATTSAEPAATPEQGPSLAETLRRIADADRLSGERDRIISECLQRQASGQLFSCTMIIERLNRNYESGVGEEFRQGRILIGKLADGETSVAMYTPSSQNEEIDALRRGDRWQGDCVLKTWNDLYSRAVLHATQLGAKGT